MPATPQYAVIPSITRSFSARINVANTARDGTGSLFTLFTPGASGSRLDDIKITATGITTAGMLRFFVFNTITAQNHLLQEVTVLAVTPSSTIPAFSSALINLGLTLAPGELVKVSTNNAETFDVICTRRGDV